MKIHKKVSGQENNLSLTTDTQLFTLLILILVEEEVVFAGVVGPDFLDVAEVRVDMAGKYRSAQQHGIAHLVGNFVQIRH